jgi:hypothetical protein
MTERRRGWPGDASDHRVWSALAMSAMVGCTAPAHADDRDGERGIYLDVQPDRLGFDHALQVRRSRTEVAHELHDGDQVRSGDRIRISVQTSVDAYLYLAFCSHHGITRYPASGGIRTRAGVLAVAPADGGDLVIDDEPGTEVLYVVVSTSELAVADPRLAAALAPTRPSTRAQDCGPALDASLRSPPSSTPSSTAMATPPAPRPQIARPLVIRGERTARRPLPTEAKPDDPYAPSTSTPAGAPPKLREVAPPAPPDPDFVRSPGNVVWYRRDTRGARAVVAADPTGIALVRHTFAHVAATSP